MTQDRKHPLLIIGLGNPGDEYEDTPHNLGRLCISRYTQALGFPDFALEKKFNALLSRGIAHERRVIAALPETFMNNSGEAAVAVLQFYDIAPTHLWVAHDDIDLPVGCVRVAFDGGAAGHHGVESVAEKLGDAHFWRFRIGSAPIEELTIPLEAYVLKKNAIAHEVLDNIISRAGYLFTLALEKGIEEAQKQSD